VVKLNVVVYTCHLRYLGGRGKEDDKFEASPSKVIKTLFEKQNTNKRVVVRGGEGDRIQVVGDLPSMCKATPRFHLTPSQNGSHQETKNKCW
jgi:hypothetical protein